MRDVPTVLLVRHGRSLANAGNILAGRSPGVDLDDTGRDQARALALRLVDIALAAVVSSPMQRCLQTAEPLLADRVAASPLGTKPQKMDIVVDERLTECDYGDWTGSKLAALSKDPLWKVVQAHPSGVRFPGGEAMLDMQHRAVSAVRERDAAIGREHGADALWVAVSHGDVIKSVVADALGVHLDEFQRIVVDPASVTVIRYTSLRPFVLRVNDRGSLFDLRAPAKKRRRRARSDSDAVVGGGTA